MSISHKIISPFVTLFVALTGMFPTTGTSGGDCDWNVMPSEKAD